LPSSSTQRPPPPGPPGTYLLFFKGGSESMICDEAARGLAGVRVGRRGDDSGAAILFDTAVVALRWVYSDRGFFDAFRCSSLTVYVAAPASFVVPAFLRSYVLLLFGC
ncbi:hypothetical protein KCU65_g200, partial [Aureobasidium melanogenum]